MKKICIMTAVHPPFDGRIFHKEAKSLAAAGYAVTLIAPHDKEEVVDGVRVRNVRKRKWRLARVIFTGGQILRFAVDEKADAYHFHDPELLAVAVLLKRLGKKVIYDVHEDFSEVCLDRPYIPKFFRGLVSMMFEKLEKRIAPSLDFVIAASDTIQEKFKSVGAATKTVKNFPAIVTDPVRGRRMNGESIKIIFVGHLGPTRGILELIQACNLLEKRKSICIDLYGSIIPRFVHRIRKADVEGLVHIHGTVPFEESIARIQEADVGYVCDFPVKRNMLAIPVKLLEYMSAGIPVIASDFPKWREIVQRAGCGLLVDPLDPRAIAAAIRFLLTHPEEAEAMGRRGRRAVAESYNWPAESSKLLELYGQILGSA